jgi:hypothetical protein
MSAAMPLLELADSLPQNAPQPELPEPLDCLAWEERVDKWGIINPGTWLDQPKWFMEDIRAAGHGRSKWQSKQDERVQSMDIPDAIPMMTR